MGNLLKKMARGMYSTKAEPLKDVAPNFFELQAKDLQGKVFSFAELKGKKAFLVVNVASGCQLTNRNYREMNKLYSQYSSKGLEILCFPCNQFYNREPKCDADIELFLREHFQPEFKVFGKIDCNGPTAHPVYKYLRSNSVDFKVQKAVPGGQPQEEYKPIPLTFAKFLLDGNGRVRKYYEPIIYPLSIKDDIEALLN